VTIEKILEWYATLLSTHICAQIKIKKIKIEHPYISLPL
jgi:hypothetical protein